MATMLGRPRNPPEPSFMNEDQKAQYLKSLRNNSFSRPTGSRPPPPSRFSTLRRSDTEANVVAPTPEERPALVASNSMPIMPTPTLRHQGIESNITIRSPFVGRPLARPITATPTEVPAPDTAVENGTKRSSVPYIERGTRWMEKQEARSLRMALEDMDLEEEQKIHASAQDEAAEIVWKHRNPIAAGTAMGAPYPNPDIRRDYRQHLRKGSYQRSHSQDVVPIVMQRSASGGSHSSQDSQSGSVNGSLRRRSVEALRKINSPAAMMSMAKTRRTPSGQSYGGLADLVARDIAQAHRRRSSGSNKRILSGEKKLFMHPNDRIYEDPEEIQVSPENVRPAGPTKTPSLPAQVPIHVRKNPFARVRMQAEKLERSNSEPILTGPTRQHSFEPRKNSPTQSKRPWYMSNEPLPPRLPSPGNRAADDVSPKVTPTKDGREVRGDDIRAATSKQRKDYSPKLPRPTVVSDKPGRPIVSFKQDWKPKEVVMEEGKPRSPASPLKSSYTLNRSQTEPQPSGVPQIMVDEPVKPPIPTIRSPDDRGVPSIVLPDDDEPVSCRQSQEKAPQIMVDPPKGHGDVPSIHIAGAEDEQVRPANTSRQQGQRSARPLPHHAATSPLPKSTPHYTPSVRQSGVLCAHCALPIAGRILSAAGERFHPNCFVCHQCHTNLELVAFYPEPDEKRAARLGRIHARQAGEPIDFPADTSPEDAFNLELEDGDSSLRFYCHLDFHELFSPRCKSCKTPIEGEVIIACGAEWHAGHFFCAQCGDPFDSSTPFVEKDGYAWCVECHTNRYSSKCRKCRKPVTDTVVKALGHDWHGSCFVCLECNGEFEDGRYFLRGGSEDPVCVRCEERRLKA